MSHSSYRASRAAIHLAAAIALGWAPAALLVAAPTSLLAQNAGTAAGRIAGIVSGEGGAPVPGVQVTVPTTRFGAVTGADGRYLIVGVAAGTYTVRAQRLGFVAQTRTVTVTADQTATVDFQLAPAPIIITPPVSVGYMTQQRRDVSDAVSGVTATDIRDQKVATVEEALRGRIPGVQIAATGEPGRPAEVIIRGQNFTTGFGPLYVVDGMYMRSNPNLNPDDVESIEVLKDASAAAQYGAQAANGVIVMRTKRGTTGEARIEAHTYYGYQDIPTRVAMMNSTEWAALTKQAYQNAGLTPIAGVNNTSVNTNWQDALFTKGAIQDHNLSMSGGTPTASYLLSGGYLRQTGSILNTGFNRYSFRVNSDIQRSRVKVGENMSLSSSNRRGLSGYPLIDVLRFPPVIPVYDPNNASGYGFGSAAVPTYGTNPVGAQQVIDNNIQSNQVMGTAFTEIDLISHLKYRGNLGLNFENFRESDFRERTQLRYLSPTDSSRLYETANNNTSLLFENLLTYEDNLGRNHLNAVAGVTEQKQDLNALQGYRQGFTNEDLRVLNAGITANQSSSGYNTPSRLRGYLARASYAYADRYLLTGSLRRDESSRFGPNNRTADFSAISAGWVLSEEDFFRSVPLVRSSSYFKLRASTGSLGNQDIGDFRYTAPIDFGMNYPFGGSIQSGATQTSLANPNIRWQSNRQDDLGLDLGLFNDRFTFSADYYKSTSSGLLVQAPIPFSLGGDPGRIPVVNAGSMRNTGVEAGLTHHHLGSLFNLNTTLSLTTTHNRVLSLGNGGQPIFVTGPNGVPIARTAVGDPIGTFYLYKTGGIFQSAADVQAHTTTVNGVAKVLQPNAQPGDVIYQDLNHNGVIDDGDRYNAGNAIPKLSGGLFFDGKIASLDFGLQLRGSYGNKIFNAARFWSDRMDDLSNYRAGLTPWTPENHSTTTPRAVVGTAGASNARVNSDRWIENGSFLKVQNILIGYTLPASIGARAGLTALAPRVYLNFQNVHTFTKYTGWDPELLGYNSPLGRGIDDAAIFPNVRTMTIGLDFRL